MNYQDNEPSRNVWKRIAEMLLTERDSIAAIIEQWNNSEIGDYDALIGIEAVIDNIVIEKEQ